MCLVYVFLFVVLESFIHLIELQAKRHKPIEINRSIKFSSSSFFGMDCIDLNLYTSISTLVELKGGQMDISFCTLFVHMCIFIMNGKKTTNAEKNIYNHIMHTFRRRNEKERSYSTSADTNEYILSKFGNRFQSLFTFFFVVARAYRFSNSIQFVNIFIIFFISAISYPCKPVN